MDCRTLEINVMSATGLKKVNLLTRMNVYVVVYIEDGGDRAKQKKKTPANINGNTNPSWNYAMKFTVDEVSSRRNNHTFVFQLRSQRALGDRDIGEVRVPVRELLDSPAAKDGKHNYLSYQVRKANGKPKGQLSFSYKFVDNRGGHSVVDAPISSYLTGGPSTAYSPQSIYPPAVATTTYPSMYEAAYPAMSYPQGVSVQAEVYPQYPHGQYGEVCPPPPPFSLYPPPPPPFSLYPPPPPPFSLYPPPPPPSGYRYGMVSTRV